MFMFTGEPIETSNNNLKRCVVSAFTSDTRVHVRRRSECISGTTAGFPKNCC